MIRTAAELERDVDHALAVGDGGEGLLVEVYLLRDILRARVKGRARLNKLIQDARVQLSILQAVARKTEAVGRGLDQAVAKYTEDFGEPKAEEK